MKLLFFLAAFVLWFGQAQAQEFSARAGLQLLAIPGVHVAAEVDFGGLGLGARASGSYFVLWGQLQADAYGFVSIAENWQVYAGVGYGYYHFFFSKPITYLQAIIGVRLKSGIFFEVNPQRVFTEGCVNADGSIQSLDSRPCVAPAVRGSAVYYGFLFTLGFSWRL